MNAIKGSGIEEIPQLRLRRNPYPLGNFHFPCQFQVCDNPKKSFSAIRKHYCEHYKLNPNITLFPKNLEICNYNPNR